MFTTFLRWEIRTQLSNLWWMPSAMVLAQLWEWDQDDSNDTQKPVCEFSRLPWLTHFHCSFKTLTDWAWHSSLIRELQGKNMLTIALNFKNVTCIPGGSYSLGFPYLHGFWHVLIFLASYTAVVLFSYFDVKYNHHHETPEIRWVFHLFLITWYQF